MFENPSRCIDGLTSLFINFRNRKSTWFYLINSFSSVETPYILTQLVAYLSHLSGHMDIFWHNDNILNDEVGKYAKSLLARTFDTKEIVKLLNGVDDNGFSRGSLGYAVFSIVGLVDNKKKILKRIAFDDSFDEELRSNALFLFIHFEQFESSQNCIEVISVYLKRYSDTADNYLFSSMRSVLEKEGFLGHIG